MCLAHFICANFYYSVLPVILVAAFFFAVPALQQALKITDFPFCHLGKTFVSVFAGLELVVKFHYISRTFGIIYGCHQTLVMM